MQLLPQQIGDVDPIIRWGIETRLQLIEEVALGPPDLRDRRTRQGRGDESPQPVSGKGLEGRCGGL